MEARTLFGLNEITYSRNRQGGMCRSLSPGDTLNSNARVTPVGVARFVATVRLRSPRCFATNQFLSKVLVGGGSCTLCCDGGAQWTRKTRSAAV
jgi:hypothetical protein